MMASKRYYIDARNKSTLGVTYYDACSKPHADAERIALSMGFEPCYLYGSRLSKLGQPIWKKVLLHAYNLWYMWDVKRQARKLKTLHGCDIFVQYGFATEAMFDVVRLLKQGGNRLILLIHDLETFRFKDKNKAEMQMLQHIDAVIVHSEPMEKRVREIGFKGQVEKLQFFDYLNDYAIPQDETADMVEDIKIVYAGNLSKSGFVKLLHRLPIHTRLHYNLYGVHDGTLQTNDHLHYKGVFENDDISSIEGNWGLVWDGDSLDTCSGVTGEYLRLNAPFKFSLYLAKGLPVIVWEESAMARYVKEYGLGITVKGLDDIEHTIRSLTADQLAAIHHNVALYSERVKHGAMLTDALGRCLV